MRMGRLDINVLQCLDGGEKNPMWIALHEQLNMKALFAANHLTFIAEEFWLMKVSVIEGLEDD